MMDVTFTAAYLEKILIIAYLEQVANGAKKVAFIHSFPHVIVPIPGRGALNFFWRVYAIGLRVSKSRV